MAIYNEDELFWWKMGQSSRVRSIQSAPKKAGGWTAGEVAIRAGNTVTWIDYLSTSTMTLSGTSVTKLSDRLASGKDFSATGGEAPTLGATGITFDGSANVMQTAAFTYNQPATIYLVIKPLSWTANDFILGSANGCTLQQADTTPKLRIYAGTLLAYNGNATLNNFHIIRIIYNGANSSLQVNNTAALSGNAGTTNLGGSLTIGCRSAKDSYFGHFVLKGGVWRSGADSATTQSDIYNYLNTYYSLGL